MGAPAPTADGQTARAVSPEQITLTDEQYERLRSESERTGLGLAELVRRAVDRSYGSTLHDAIVEGLDASFGAWSDQDEDGAAYVDGLRRGMAQRLADI